MFSLALSGWSAIMLAFLSLVLGSPAKLGGTSAAIPRPRVVASEEGEYAVKILPKPSRTGGYLDDKATAIMFRLMPDGKEKIIWSRNLLNIPSIVIVVAPNYIDSTAADVRLLTLDDWYHTAGEHTLVVYGPGGKVLGDYGLLDIVPHDDLIALMGKHDRRSPNIFWSAETTYKLQGGYFHIHLETGTTLRVDPETGKCTAE